MSENQNRFKRISVISKQKGILLGFNNDGSIQWSKKTKGRQDKAVVFFDAHDVKNWILDQAEKGVNVGPVNLRLVVTADRNFATKAEMAAFGLSI